MAIADRSVQSYLDKINVNAETTLKLYTFGFLKVLPIGEKRLSQLTLDLSAAHPTLAPDRNQCWCYELVLGLAKQDIIFDNLCLPRAEKRDHDFERFLCQRSYREQLFKTDHVKYRLYADKKRSYTGVRQTYPSLLDSMHTLTVAQAKDSVNQLCTMLNPAEFTMIMRLYRDHAKQKDVAVELQLTLEQASHCKQSAIRKLKADWRAARIILTIDPTLSVPTR